MEKARKIGLTGGIASGKSLVAEMLAEMLGCTRLDADAVCRRILEPRAAGWQAFTESFGAQYLMPDGVINRPLLREAIFSNREFREQVNDLIHPIVKKILLEEMEQITGPNKNSMVIAEVPLLFEVHWEDIFDKVVVVFADRSTCLQRLMD